MTRREKFLGCAQVGSFVVGNNDRRGGLQVYPNFSFGDTTFGSCRVQIEVTQLGA